jgi:acetyl-CoA acetyltransferase
VRLMDGSTSLWILGGYQSDFARNLTREDRDFAALTAEIEVHDCFTPNEYLVSDHIGLTGPGESWKAIENGEIEIGGRLPINPSGGLIGDGHPVGASGVRMVVDAAKQVSGTAGDYQVEEQKRSAP